MSAPHEIISDEEIIRVHGHANFGDMSPREVVNDGVRKYAIGYTGGHTELCILLEHELITKPKPGKYSASLTQKGKRYARAVSATRTDLSQAAVAAALEAAGRIAKAWISRAMNLSPYGYEIERDNRGMVKEAMSEIRALITPAQHDALSAHVAAEVAKARAEDAAKIEALAAELQWYGEQARLCRLIHSEGDAGRHALNNDGGKRAAAALSQIGAKP